jgi:hypothetical protein
VCLWLDDFSFLCAVLLRVVLLEVRVVCVCVAVREEWQVSCCLGGREGKYIVMKACVLVGMAGWARTPQYQVYLRVCW